MQKAVFVAFGVVILLGTAFLYLGGIDVPDPEEMAAQLRSLGFWAPVAVIGLMIVHSFIPFPAELLALCAGAVFGTVLGSALIWVGAMFGALAAFFLSRWLGQEAIRNWISEEQADALDSWSDDRGALALLICRFIPVIAFNLINYAAGLTRVRIWTFVWTTGLGILPLTILSAYLGAQMKTLSWHAITLLAAACIIGAVLLSKLLKKRS
jgi:uncharacterized membrane protein YdjX (TVP38/TMEM64 family)